MQFLITCNIQTHRVVNRHISYTHQNSSIGAINVHIIIGNHFLHWGISGWALFVNLLAYRIFGSTVGTNTDKMS